MMRKSCIFIGLLLPIALYGQEYLMKEAPEVIDTYVSRFNHDDNELYKEYIPNSEAAAFLKRNIPYFDCPDKELEKTYYFRWWTYRKHIKQTPLGFVVTEFLPPVPWAKRYNTISCPAAHHFYEGRWLREGRVLADYAAFWFTEGGGTPRQYSFGAADAIYQYALVHHNPQLLADLYPKLKENFAKWEEERLDDTGLFWQVDGLDGMEVSVSGALAKGDKGYRPTINSYMYGEAAALAKIAALTGHNDEAAHFQARAEQIKTHINTRLWDKEAAFYKVIPMNGQMAFSPARELLDYTPWLYHIAPEEYAVAWKQLFDPKGFAAPYGPTTVEQRCPNFRVAYEGHECQWNGPSWPFLTSLVLTALADHLERHPATTVTREDYFQLLQTYSNSHRMVTASGDTLCWIDENLNPFTGDWLSRTRLKSWKNGTWDAGKGGEERGKDYNHSSFCNLIISGLMGVRPADDGSIDINPLLPEGRWDYFCLDNIACGGKNLTLLYDKRGDRYGKGKGFRVYVDGKCRFHARKVCRFVVR